MPVVVLDTNILVSAIRSTRGASFQVLSSVGTGLFDIAVSVPLVLEYEDAMLRHVEHSNLEETDIRDVIDYLCTVAKLQHIYFLWRPLLRDPKDDLVVEVAIAAGCDAIITHNRKDFEGIEALGLRILTPRAFLKEIRS
jgi:putative PIN family toxin of toxin-antitoxin system